MTTAEQIATITDTTTGSFNTLHEVTDRAKVVTLAHDMIANGWQGAPIVVDSENAFTGVHRIAAVAYALREDGEEIETLYVEISDLCELYGIDWTTLLLDEHDGDTYAAAAELRYQLPREVVDYLGFDVDGAL
jgi:hypothetical protein